MKSEMNTLKPYEPPVTTAKVERRRYFKIIKKQISNGKQC